MQPSPCSETSRPCVPSVRVRINIPPRCPSDQAVKPLRTRECRRVFPRAYVLFEPRERLPQALELLFPEPGGQLLVEADHRLQERAEEPLSLLGQLNTHGSAVFGIAAADDESGLLEPVEVARQRRPLDADRAREVELRSPGRLLQRGEH